MTQHKQFFFYFLVLSRFFYYQVKSLDQVCECMYGNVCMTVKTDNKRLMSANKGT